MYLRQRILLSMELAISAIILAFITGGSNLLIAEKVQERVRIYTRTVEFDYFDWTLDAIGQKLFMASIDSPYFFNADQQRKVVSDYLLLIEEIQQTENELNLIYTDPDIQDAEAVSFDLKDYLESLYSRQVELAPFAEAVLEAQVTAVLAELKLTVGGQPLPPVLFHISPLPYHLVISPRDKIQQDAAISLVPELSIDRQVALEKVVEQGMDVSALVVPVGGIGSYPTMVMRTTSLEWLVDTIAHEWIHNWLSLQPLGFNYDSTPEMRTMNETTASIAGGEIAELTLHWFYPTLAWEDILQPTSLFLAPIPPDGWPRPVFDFRAEMHSTRIHVDELLAQGRIEEAETFMEARRKVFWENGYPIRKLNQAYFAFFGAYADTPGGAAGEDPVGPAVRRLRSQSSTLTDFLETMAGLSSYQELLDIISP